MSGRWALTLWCALCGSLPTLAQARPPGVEGTIWQRAVPAAARELTLRAALYRDYEGLADDRDQARIRVALIDWGRGQLPLDPGNVILLAHFRIELSLVTSGSARGLGERWVEALGVAVTRVNAPALRALGYLDLARLERAEERGNAEYFLSQGLAWSIEDERTSDLLFLRGLARLHVAQKAQDQALLVAAESDFERARELAGTQRARAACLAGASWAADARGEKARSALWAKAAAVVLASAVDTTGLPLTHGLSTTPEETAELELRLAQGRALAVPPVPKE